MHSDSVSTDIKVAEIVESDLAKKWLIESIETNFKTAEGLIDSICTKDYATYKSDAIGVEYDGGMTQQAFEKNWKKWVAQNQWLVWSFLRVILSIWMVLRFTCPWQSFSWHRFSISI